MPSGKQVLSWLNECSSFSEAYNEESRVLTMTSVTTINIKDPDGILPSERKLISGMTDREKSTFFQKQLSRPDLMHSKVVVTGGEIADLYD